MAEPRRKLTYADLQVTPDDGRRYELVRGALVMTPSPSPQHQRISKRLSRMLENYFEARGIGEVFPAPTDVILTDEDVFVPDLLIVGDPSHVSARGIEGPPILVVEILSPSTRAQDVGFKSHRYAELGITHYWIVDPDRKRLECFRLSDGAYHRLATAEGDAPLTHPAWSGLTVDLAALWR